MLRAILDASAGDDDDQDDAMADEATSSEVVPKSTASDNKAFLASKLRYEGSEGDERCLDSEGNGVMMGWELPIMVETARLLGAGREQDSLSVLNVGFGLGLIDTELQKHEPGRHVIVEPHPDVLAFARSKGWYEKPGVEIFEGTWQEFIKAYEAGEVEGEFDAIYVSYSSTPSLSRRLLAKTAATLPVRHVLRTLQRPPCVLRRPAESAARSRCAILLLPWAWRDEHDLLRLLHERVGDALARSRIDD